MPYLRYQIDCAVPLPLSPLFEAERATIEAEIARLKSYAKRINAGTPQEENTVVAHYHECNNDTQQPCGAWQEI